MWEKKQKQSGGIGKEQSRLPPERSKFQMRQEIRTDKCGRGGGRGPCGREVRCQNFSSLFGHLEPRIMCSFYPDIAFFFFFSYRPLGSKAYVAVTGGYRTSSVGMRSVN